MDSAMAETAKVIFIEGYQEDVLVIPLGQNLYQLEESSVLKDARYHDVIEAERQTDNTLIENAQKRSLKMLVEGSVVQAAGAADKDSNVLARVHASAGTGMTCILRR